MRRLMDLPATDDLEYTRHDRWTALMEACNFGHEPIVALLLLQPSLDLDAVNLRYIQSTPVKWEPENRLIGSDKGLQLDLFTSQTTPVKREEHLLSGT